MKSREEACRYADGLMDGENPILDELKVSYWHFGKVELKALMDFIYGEPEGKDDILKCRGN